MHSMTTMAGTPYNKALHQTRRGGVARFVRLGPVVEARLAGEGRCSTGQRVRRPSLFLTMLWGLSLTACDGGTTVKGHVQSLSGDPLRGAAVRLVHQRHEKQVSTGLDGSFRVGFLHEPGLRVPLRLEVSMPNHRGVTIDLVGTSEYECTVRLADETDKSQGVSVLGSKDMCRKIER